MTLLKNFRAYLINNWMNKNLNLNQDLDNASKVIELKVKLKNGQQPLIEVFKGALFKKLKKEVDFLEFVKVTDIEKRRISAG